MPPKGYNNITVRREVREELEKLRQEIGVRDFSDLLVLLVKIYREYTSVTSKIEGILTSISSKLDILLTSNTSTSTTTSGRRETSPDPSSTANSGRRSDTPKDTSITKTSSTRTFCKDKFEIRDVSRYVKKLKDEGVLIDWWDEETRYCFEVKG
jgi:predicted CopG family antitoxin